MSRVYEAYQQFTETFTTEEIQQEKALQAQWQWLQEQESLDPSAKINTKKAKREINNLYKSLKNGN